MTPFFLPILQSTIETVAQQRKNLNSLGVSHEFLLIPFQLQLEAQAYEAHKFRATSDHNSLNCEFDDEVLSSLLKLFEPSKGKIWCRIWHVFLCISIQVL